MRIGILTGGGDCPGLNAVIRAVVRKGEHDHADEFVGFLDSWDGVLHDRWMPLSVASLRGMLPRGGTLLGTRRGSPLDLPDGPQQAMEALARHRLDALLVIGGNGSLTVASMLHRQCGMPVVGVPKTIDNDIEGTDVTFGFMTAVQTATDAIDRLHTTAESHDRVMVVEVMGRHTGWIATYAGVAGGATAILIPERPFDLDEVCALLAHRHARGRYASIVVVAEGALPAEGTMSIPPRTVDRYGHVSLGGIAELIAPEIQSRTGFETRVVLLGHLLRGGSPGAYDRMLATRYGLAALDAVHAQAFGNMVVLRNDRVHWTSLEVAEGRTRTLDLHLYDDVAQVFFG
jgi:ATP-dependent phosphofructokinase / diphosphate-dependent phosphofructokinase